MKILLIDAYDSFVHIIYNYILRLGHDCNLVRSNKIKQDTFVDCDVIFLGPGPGHPKESSYIDIISKYKDKKTIFGVCLGMQAIAMFFGYNIVPANSKVHGKVSSIKHNGTSIFSNLPNPLNVVRYHSLIADNNNQLNNELEVTAYSIDENYIMAIKHKTLPIEGVQFHPESILTNKGYILLKNFFLQVQNKQLINK